MKINDKHYPVLKYLNWQKPLWQHPIALKTGDLDAFKLDKDEEDEPEVIRRTQPIAKLLFTNWPRLAKVFSKNIDMVSNPFFQAAMQNNQKFLDDKMILFNMLKKGQPVSGTLIWGKIVFNYYYDGCETKDATCIILCHYECRLVYACWYDGKEKHEWWSEVNGCVTGIKPIDAFFRQAPLIALIFKKYAEIETVEAKSNKKVKLPDGEKLLVESGMNINYIDCSWFRNIIRKEGFLVSGHFRFQPYKNEQKEWDYKLIYIEPYQKHGYTRTAKKIIAERKEI